jgi:hypothetical protein
MEPFLGILQGRALNDDDYLVQSRDVMFDHLVWWGETLKAADKERPLRATWPTDNRQVSRSLPCLMKCWPLIGTVPGQALAAGAIRATYPPHHRLPARNAHRPAAHDSAPRWRDREHWSTHRNPSLGGSRCLYGGEGPSSTQNTARPACIVLRALVAHFHANSGTARAAPLEIIRLKRLR